MNLGLSFPRMYLNKPFDSLCGRYEQEDLITLHQFKFLPSPICIFLLSILGYFQLILYQLYLLHGFSCHFRTHWYPSTNIIPANGSFYITVSASYGAISILAWKMLLYENSINCNFSSCVAPNSSMHALNISSRVWIVRSVWASVAGWNDVLRLRVVPNASWNLCQKWDKIIGSLFEMIVLGILWSHSILLTYASATCYWFHAAFIVINLVVLVNLSTTTHIVSLLFRVFGWPVTNSMEIESHFHFVIGMVVIVLTSFLDWTSPSGKSCILQQIDSHLFVILSTRNTFSNPVPFYPFPDVLNKSYYEPSLKSYPLILNH